MRVSIDKCLSTSKREYISNELWDVIGTRISNEQCENGVVLDLDVTNLGGKTNCQDRQNLNLKGVYNYYVLNMS